MLETSLLNPFGENLEIRGNSVYWINNGILVRKFTFSEGTTISSAIFTSFQTPHRSKSFSATQNSTEDAIVIITTQCAHVYYLSGATFLVSLPYSISKVLSCDRGLILSRDTSSDEPNIDSFVIPNFFIMSDPLLDIGSIVSSSVASISHSEEMIYFGDSSTANALCATFDVNKAMLKIYSVRHISSQPSNFSNNFFVKPKDYSRRRSSRLGLGHNDTTDIESTLETSVFQSRLDLSLSHTRDIGGLEASESATNHTTTSYNGQQHIQKEVLLTLVESFQLNSYISNLDVHLFSFSSSYCVAVTDTVQRQAIFLTFEQDTFQKSFKFKGSQKIEALSVSPIKLGINESSREIAIILTVNSLVYFYDSFSQIQSDLMRFPFHWKRVTQLSINCGSVYAITDEGHYKTELKLEPQDFLVTKCFQMLGLILTEPEFISWNFLWASILFTESSFTEWDAFVSAIILLIIPHDTITNHSHDFLSNPESYTFSDQYCIYLKNLPNLQRPPDDALVNNHNFFRHFIFSLFLIKEDARLDIALQGEVVHLEELLHHLLSWSDCLSTWCASIFDHHLKRVPSKFLAFINRN